MIGQTVSHYRIVEKLGQGGMGIVYHAKDTRLGRSVALKFLPDDLAKSERALRRFQREARTASALNHPNICTVYEIDEHQGRHFIAMEMLEGQTLRDFIQGRPLPLDCFLDLSLQMIDALAAAHATGIVHRDIKPTNVFVNRRGQVKVLDFGLAKWVPALQEKERTAGEPGAPQSATADVILSSSYLPIGTVAYMSPEQSRGEEVDSRADLFSFGLVLYEMATGTAAFKGPTAAVVFHEVLSQAPLRPSEISPAIPARMEEIILRLLEKDRDMRYQTSSDLRADLKRLKRDWESDRKGGQSSISGGSPAREKLPRRAEFPGRETPSEPGGAHATRVSGRWWRATWRHQAAGLAAGIAAMVVILSMILWPKPVDLPCVLLGNFEGETAAVSPALLRFAVERVLSQFLDLVVVDEQEYGLMVTLRRERQGLSTGSAGRTDRLQRLLGVAGEEEDLRPAVQVSGHVFDSPTGMALRMRITNRGETEDALFEYRGVNDLLVRGIDELALAIWRLYHDHPGTGPGAPADYRPATSLLSPHWDALLHFWRGAEAWKRLDVMPAQQELRFALEIDREFALARLMLGELLVFQNQWSLARTEIDTARLHRTALTEIDQLRADALYARAAGNTHEERICLQKLTELRPHRKEYRYELAESYFHTADVEQAIPRYLDALKLDPQYALAHNHLGLCYTWKGDHARAIEALRKYLQIDRSANALDSIGDAYFCAGAYEEAVKYKFMAVQQDPSLYYALRSLPYIDLFRGRFRKAE
ncbi:MAG: serine/threonine-protein kinase, partial [Acidobacteriota bacterium]